jgi:hypothetical protein
MKGGYFLNSGILFRIAVSAYQRLESAPSDKAGGQNDALVAILFSAATLEAFVAELALMAQSDSAFFGEKLLQSVAAVLDEAEASERLSQTQVPSRQEPPRRRDLRQRGATLPRL